MGTGKYRTWRTVWIFLATLVGCASVPEFNFQEPLKATRSLEPAIFLCSSYTPPNHSTKRVASLKPYLDCLEELRKTFKEALEPSPVHVFHMELKDTYSDLHESYWNEDLSAAYQIAIQALLRALWTHRLKSPNLRLHLSWIEFQRIQDLFPQTFARLNLGVVKPEHFSETEDFFEQTLFRVLDLQTLFELATVSQCHQIQSIKKKWLTTLAFREDLFRIKRLAPASLERYAIQKRYKQDLINLNEDLLPLLKNLKKNSEHNRCKLPPIIPIRPS